VTIDPLVATEQAKLTASDGAAGDAFGWSVDLDGDTAVVGAIANGLRGAAYVFVRSGTTWTEQQKLVAADGFALDLFGTDVAIDGDTAIVGAPGDDPPTGSGSAYVFVRTGTAWTQQAKLRAPDAAEFDDFGEAVALDGDTAVVGAHFDDHDAGGNAGSAYVFVRSGGVWTLEQKLTAADASTNDNFGDALAIDGHTVVVGSRAIAALGAGAVYVFGRTGASWTQLQKLVASDAASADFLGASAGPCLALHGDTLVAGAEGKDVGPVLNAGAAYVFVRDGATFVERQRLVASDGAPSDVFGRAVALDGDIAVIGAPGDDGAGESSGAAYVFSRSGTAFAEQTKVAASDAAAGDVFGSHLAVDGDTVVVGARFDDDRGMNSGSAYVYALEPGGIAFDIAALRAAVAASLAGLGPGDDGFDELASVLIFLDETGPAVRGRERHGARPARERHGEAQGRGPEGDRLRLVPGGPALHRPRGVRRGRDPRFGRVPERHRGRAPRAAGRDRLPGPGDREVRRRRLRGGLSTPSRRRRTSGSRPSRRSCPELEGARGRRRHVLSPL